MHDQPMWMSIHGSRICTTAGLCLLATGGGRVTLKRFVCHPEPIRCGSTGIDARRYRVWWVLLELELAQGLTQGLLGLARSPVTVTHGSPAGNLND
jgi:hypothetical protein